MFRSIYCLSSVMGLVLASAALTDEPGVALAIARYRNQRLAEQATPSERKALLAVTGAGANVILDESGSVVSVQLEGCLFPDSLLAVLREFPRMKQLQLGHSKVSDEGLAHLRGLNNLESLTLIQTNIGDKGLAHLEGLPKLKSLTLHMSLVTDAGMRSLARIPTLEQLDLENVPLTDAGLAQIAGLTNLRKLLLSHTKITDAGLDHLHAVANLEELGLDSTAVSDAGLAHLRNLKKLKELDLEHTAVGDSGLKWLLEMPLLNTLNLRHTNVSTQGLARLKGLGELRRLWAGESQFFETPPTKQWQIWMASAYGDDIYVYEIGTFKLLKRITVGPNPHGLSATADGRTVHVALEHFDDPVGELLWIDTRRFDITARINVGPQPQEIECTPDGSWIYVPCADGQWQIVDGHERRIVKSIQTGGRPHNTVVSPDGKRMYLSPMGYPHAVTIVDVEGGHNVIGEIPFRDVTRPPAITSDERLFFQNIDNMLGFQVADIGQRHVIKTIEHFIPQQRREEWSRSHGLGVRPDQQEIWSCNVEHHLVHVHEMTSGNYREIARITLPGPVYWLSFSPDSKYCFVSVRSKRQVAVIDCASKNIVKMLDGGEAVKRTQVVGVPLD